MPAENNIDASLFPPDGLAIVIGSTGAIGKALSTKLEDSKKFGKVIGLSRSSTPSIDIRREQEISNCAQFIKAKSTDVRLIINATGFLHGGGYMPEKSFREISPEHMAHAFAINAIGPALVMKHFLPLLPVQGKSVFVSLSAKVGSIGDNELGGWYSYRASKAAMNQLVKTSSIELRRRRRDAICVAIHPGTVESPISSPFQKFGLTIKSPEEAATNIVDVIEKLTPIDSGSFLDYSGSPLPW